MKKGLKVTLIVLAAAVAGGALVYAAPIAHQWLADHVGNDSDSSSSQDSEDSTPEEISSTDGSLSAKITGGSVFGNSKMNAVSAGATKTLTLTISPANATDKKIIVATSDATKVSISASEVISGNSVTLTLANGEFNGAVNITAYPEALPSSVVTIPVTVYNFIKTLSLEACVISDDPVEDVYRDYSGNGNPILAEIDGNDQGYSNGVFIGVSASYALTINSPKYNTDGFARAYMILKGTPRDVTILPSSTAKPAWAVSADVADQTTKVMEYVVELNTTNGTALSFTQEDGHVTFSTATYVAPTGLTAGNTSIQFN